MTNKLPDFIAGAITNSPQDALAIVLWWELKTITVDDAIALAAEIRRGAGRVPGPGRQFPAGV